MSESIFFRYHPDPMWVLDVESMAFIDVNNAAHQMYGHTPGKLADQDISVLLAPADIEALTRHARTHSSIPAVWQHVSAERVVLANVAKVADVYSGSERLLVNILQRGSTAGAGDIPIPENRDEQQLRQAQKMEIIGQLTGGIAHDFNNLLTIILGNTELLSLHLINNPELHSLAKMAADAAANGAELTSRLLTFARRQTLTPGIVDVHQLLTNMYPLLRRALGRHINIQIDQAGDNLKIEVDPVQLESAMLNLAINARDAMPDGGQLTISVHLREITGESTTRTPAALLSATSSAATMTSSLAATPWLSESVISAGNYLGITVSDNGVGIAPDILPRVFDPFFTTKQTGKGSGLGLSMVAGFVEQSKGFLDLQSKPGKGTDMTLYFPLAASESVPASNMVARKTRLTGGHEHILVVEDNDLVREYLSRQLQALGYLIVLASNGSDALEILREDQHFDLLLTDIIMPGGINGRELAEAARTLRPSIKVLFTSGFTDGTLENDGRLPAGVDLLAKPYRRQELASKLRKVLD